MPTEPATEPRDGCEPDTLDLRGEVCPMTFVRTRVALEPLDPGARLRVLIDHPPARESLPRSLRDVGCRVVEAAELAPGVWALAVERGRGVL